jgi:hypothetical protein
MHVLLSFRSPFSLLPMRLGEKRRREIETAKEKRKKKPTKLYSSSLLSWK